MQEFTGTAFFVTMGDARLRPPQTVPTTDGQYAMHAAVTDVQYRGDARRPPAATPQLQNLLFDRHREAVGRALRPARAGVQPRPPLFSITPPPSRKHPPWGARVSAYSSQRF